MRRSWLVIVCLLAWGGSGGARAASPAPSTERFHFALIGDRTGGHQPGVYERTLTEIRSLEPDILVSVGDHIEGYSADRAVLDPMWDEYQGLIAGLSCPFYMCPGNHDILNDAQEALWRSRTGREPNYGFDQGGVHFVILDTGRWESSEEWLAYGTHRAWLEQELAAHPTSSLTVVVYHKPFWYDTLSEDRPDPLHEIFVRHGVDAVFNGHFHQYGSARYDGIDYTIVGSSGGAIDGAPEQGSFYHWVWATVADGQLTWAVVAQDGIRPTDTVLIADQKFYQRAYDEYAQLLPFLSDAGAGRAECRLALRNAIPGAPLRSNLVWEELPNWSISPAQRPIDLPAGASEEFAFRIRRAGAFYPLPRLRFDYPYRPGRTFHFEQALPALRRQTVARLAQKPSLDGRLDEAAWRGAARVDHLGAPNGSLAAIEPTEFLFGYDAEALYLGARCSQAHLESLLVAAAERDGAVARDDCVGYFFCPDLGSQIFYQIYINAAGVIFDQQVQWVPSGRNQGLGPDWNGEVEVRTHRGDGFWSSEVRVPFRTLKAAAPARGTTWRANFRRKEMARGSSADWQVPIGFNPNRFGELVFE